MFFNKEMDCEKCKIKTNKKTICTFDSSRQGRIKQGQKIKVCQKCCLEMLFDELKQNANKSLIVQPSNQYNTYAFYGFKELLDGSKNSVHIDKDTKFIENLRSLLPEDQTTCKCYTNIAIYTWCPVNIYMGSNPFSMEINSHEKIKCVHLCKDCLIDLFNKKVEENSIQFSVIFPMTDEEGFYTPWEV